MKVVSGVKVVSVILQTDCANFQWLLRKGLSCLLAV